MRADGWWTDETVVDRARALACEAPDQVLIVDGPHHLTAGKALESATVLAQTLRARGFVPGDVISVMLPNWHEAALIYLAAAMAGLVTHPVCIAEDEERLCVMLSETGSRAIFIPELWGTIDYPALLADISARHGPSPEVVVVRGGSSATEETSRFESLLAAHGHTMLPCAPTNADSVKTILYAPAERHHSVKGALHSHNSVHALVRQSQLQWGITPQSRLFVTDSQGMIGNSSLAIEAAWLLGCTVILQEAWNPVEAGALIAREGCTHTVGTAAMLAGLVAIARGTGAELSTLRLFACFDSVPPALAQEAATVLPRCRIERIIASIELPATVVVTPERVGADGQSSPLDCRGLPDIKLIERLGTCDPVDGEICTRAPQMLVGYLWAEDERPVFDAEGFYRTGLLGRFTREEGLVITGRVDDPQPAQPAGDIVDTVAGTHGSDESSNDSSSAQGYAPEQAATRNKPLP